MAKRKSYWSLFSLFILMLISPIWAGGAQSFHKECVGAQAGLKSSAGVHPNATDIWLGQDKAKHFLAGSILTMHSFWVLHQQSQLKQANARTGAIALTGLISILKEIIDSQSPENHFCKKDLLMDFLGISMGLIWINNTTWDR